MSKSLSSRVAALEAVTEDLPEPDRLLMVVCYRRTGDPEGRDEGVYFNADRSCAEVVFDGEFPDPGVIAALRERMPGDGSGCIVTSYTPDPRYDRP